LPLARNFDLYGKQLMIQNIEQKTKRELIEIVNIQQSEYLKLKVDFDLVNEIRGSLLFSPQPFRAGGVIDNPSPPKPQSHRFAAGEVVEIPASPKPLGPMYPPISRIELMFPIFCVCCAAIGCVFAFLVNV
jgi:hypothetical protein